MTALGAQGQGEGRGSGQIEWPEMGLRKGLKRYGLVAIAVPGLVLLPAISTLARPLHARGGKVYVDWGQNGHGITIVAPFSLRPVPDASASCPLRWSEVNGRLDPARFNLRTLPKRFEKMDDPLAGVLGPGVDMGAAIAAIEERMRRTGKELE